MATTSPTSQNTVEDVLKRWMAFAQCDSNKELEENVERLKEFFSDDDFAPSQSQQEHKGDGDDHICPLASASEFATQYAMWLPFIVNANLT